MIDRFRQLPASLAEHARVVRLGGTIPALMCHPDWISPLPTVLWMHGRTAYKEIDSGRFSRLLRAGIASVAIDLPGHGERLDRRGGENGAGDTLEVMGEAVGEVDRVVEALADPIYQGVFDLDRMGIGGMSLGGMVSLRRLCDTHDFVCASVECSCGDLWALYNPSGGTLPWGVGFDEGKVAPLDPAQHLEGFRPIPLLALHSEADRIVPWRVQHDFLLKLRRHNSGMDADPSMVHWRTWPTTGAPEEHSGFGRVGNEAKNAQVEFFARHLNAELR